MKIPNIRFLSYFLSAVLTAGSSLLVLSCSFISAESSSVLVIPSLPEALGAFGDSVMWEVSGSCTASGLYKSGDVITLTAAAHPEGDWVCIQPQFSMDRGWDTTFQVCLPVMGWVTGMDLAPNRYGGLVALLLERASKGEIPFRGLNILRLVQELTQRNIDSTTADIDRILAALARRLISVRDLSPRVLRVAQCALPPGRWVDAKGILITENNQWSVVSTMLPMGRSDLFRQDGQAFLRVNVMEDGTGAPTVFWVLHSKT